MLFQFRAKQHFMLSTAMVGVVAFVMPTAAAADCVINSTANTVRCTGADTSPQDIAVPSPDVLSFNQTASGIYGGVLSGTGEVDFFGLNGATPTVLTLTGHNQADFTGPMTFTSGTVSIADAHNIGAGLLQFNGGTLQTTGATDLTNNLTLGIGGGTFNTLADTALYGGISGPGGLTKTGNSILDLNGPNTYAGGTTVSAGILRGIAGLGLQGNIINNSEVELSGYLQTYSGNMSGTGAVRIHNSATVGLSGTNTYTGATIIDPGADLIIFSTTALAPQSTYTVNATLELAYGSATGTIGGLSGAGMVTGGGTLAVGANNSSTTYSGLFGLGGTLGVPFESLTKVGTGTLTLTSTLGSVLTGTLGVTGGTLALNGTMTAASTTVANGATLNIGPAGVLASPVSAAAGSTLIINGLVNGVVTNAGAASGSGTVLQAFTNSGSLSPGNSPGIFQIVNGPFTQTSTGTLNIDLTPSNVAGTGYDQVLITGTPGTAVLGGTLALHPQTGVLYVAGTNYDVINAAGGITGTFATTTGNSISPFLSFATTGIVTIAGTNQVYRITVSRTSYATGIGAGATANQIAVANGFQGLVTGATGDAATLVTSVDNMTVAQAKSFFDQVSPEPYGAYANALYNQGELLTRQVALQMHGTANPGGGLSFWGRGYGVWGNGSNRGISFGTDQDVYGGALGLDYREGGLTVGAAGGYSHDKLTYALGNSTGRVNSWQFGGYLDYAAGPIDFDLQAAYEHGSISTTKSINVTGIANVASIARVATASPSGHLWRAIGTVGYNAPLGTGYSVRPFVGFDWTDGSIDTFTEAGANAADLTVNSIKIRRTDAVVGVDVGSSGGTGIAPYGRLAYKYDLSDHHNNISAFFNGNPATTFTVAAVPLGRSEFDADAGLSYSPNRSFMVFAGYEGTFRNDLKSNGVSAGFRVSFGGAEAAPPPPPPPPAPPPPPPATQTCPDGSVIDATATCPPPPPPPPPPPAQRGERG